MSRPAVAAFVCAMLAQAPPDKALEDQHLLELLSVKRVFVDRLTGGETAAQMRDMIISSLQSSRLFVVTENAERADAFLRGAAEDLVFTETHQSSEGLQARASFGTGTSSAKTGRSYGGVGVGENESNRSAERRHEATAAVRLVNKDGDVIWSTTQESLGGKYRGASADVADRISRKLAEDITRARKLRPAPATPSP